MDIGGGRNMSRDISGRKKSRVMSQNTSDRRDNSRERDKGYGSCGVGGGCETFFSFSTGTGTRTRRD